MSSLFQPIQHLKALLHKFDLTPGTLFTIGALALFFGVFLLYPLAYSLRAAFISDGRFTLQFVALIFQNPTLLTCIVNSLKVGIVATVLTMAISLPLAWLMVRCRFPGQGILQGLLLMPIVLPPFVGAIGIKEMLSRYGALNMLLVKLGIIDRAQPIDWLGGGFWCVVILQALHLYPIMYLNFASALANVDRTLEEAAESLGAHGWLRFRTVTMPLMLPGIFAGASLVFIFAFTDLGTPLIFLYNQVIPVRIFSMVERATEDPTGYALILLVIVITVILFTISKCLMERREVATLPRGPGGIVVHVLHGWRGWLALCAIGVLLILAVMPHISVFLNALSRRWVMSVLPNEFTLKHFEAIVQHPITTISIRNSFIYAIASTTIDALLGVTIAYVLARRRIPFKGLLDITAMLPLALPGVVIAFGYVGCFAGTFLDPRQNAAPLLIISYAVRRLPYAVRACYAGFQQVSVTLEEASASLGAPPVHTLAKITIPLITAHIIAGAILTFAFAMLEVSDSLILALNVRYFPMTKAIYVLSKRVGDGPQIASAMGVLGMVILAVSLIIASKLLGKRMGELFRA